MRCQRRELPIYEDKCNCIFSKSDIEKCIYKPQDLNGKILKITVTENEGQIAIADRDIETGEIYIIDIKNTGEGE